MSVVKGRIHTHTNIPPDDVVSPAEMNRVQDDIISVAGQIAGAAGDMHYPHITTADNLLAFTTGADLLTITAGQIFWVGGIRFNTTDLSNMAITIPDGTDGYIRATVGVTNGQIADPAADPLTRVISLTLSIENGSEADPEGTGGGPSSRTSTRLFKVVKAAGGDVPTVTAYANDGHAGVGDSGSYSLRVDLATPVTILSSGSATSFADVSCVSAVPDGAKAVILAVEIDGRTAIELRADGGTSLYGADTESIAGGPFTSTVECPCSSGRVIEYRIPTGYTVTLKVVGYYT